MIFMEIGRSSPRHQELAVLYPRSITLQAHINEYFIIVVRFCASILHFAQKSALRQFASTLSDATIKTTQTELAARAKEIGDEIQLLVARRIEDEAEENSQFRSLSKKFSKSVSHQQDVAAKIRILNKCSSYDYETAWKQLRKSGNTTLFAQTTDYLEWRMQTKSCTLLYLGILGCGKSVTMANIVDDLNLSIAENHKASVAYFFIRPDIPASLQARTVIGAIVRQLLRAKHNLANMAEGSNVAFGKENMLSLLRRSMPRQHKIYLVLDGLDLCQPSGRSEVTKFLGQLQENFWVLICASYRQEPNVELDVTLHNFQSVKAVLLPDNESDIRTPMAHVRSEKDRSIRSFFGWVTALFKTYK